MCPIFLVATSLLRDMFQKFVFFVHTKHSKICHNLVQRELKLEVSNVVNYGINNISGYFLSKGLSTNNTKVLHNIIQI